jgi:hypothetical protein
MRLPLTVIGSTITLIILMPLAARGQPLKPPETPDPWLIRSQTITEHLLKDAPALTAFDRAILFARLGDVWWKDDQERARAWMRKAIETVEYIPDQDPDDHSRRVATARIILKIITARDEKLGRRVKEIIAASQEHDSNRDRDRNADALMDEALALVESDPQRAALLGAEALRVGRPRMLLSLLWRLHSSNPKLSDGLFMQGVAVVREKFNDDLLVSLLRFAFPVLVEIEPSEPVLSDPLRAQVLLLVASHFRNTMMGAESKAAQCSSIMGFIYTTAPLLPEFERLLPAEESSLVRQLLVDCQSRDSIVQQRVEDAQNSTPLKTVDDLLKAAEKARDMKARTVLQLRAAQLAAHQDEFERANKILDDMDDEARKFMEGSWEAFRWEWGVAAALDHLKHDDLAGLRRTIESTPAGARATVQIGVAYELRADESNRSLVTELTQSGRQGLSKSGLPDDEIAAWHLTLLILYAKFLPEESFPVLRDTIAALNREPKRAYVEVIRSELTEAESEYKLPISMLATDEFAFLDAVSAVESPAKRARIRLELLSESLNKHRTAANSRKAASRQ